MYRSFTVSYGQSLNFLLRVFYYLSVILLPSSWFLQGCVYVRFNFLEVALRFKLAIFSLQFYCLLYSLYTINTSPFARLCNLELFVSQLVYSTLNFSEKDGILPFSAYLFTNAQNFLLEVTQRSKYEIKALSICQEVAWHYNVFDARLTSSCIICLDHHGDKKTISKGLPSYKYTG